MIGVAYAILLFSLTLCLDPAIPLELLSVDVPRWVPQGTRAELSCRWRLGPDILYSVKWYKDGQEFFRYVPRDAEPRRRFPLPGVVVEDANPFGSELVLSPAALQTSGRYRCEVSGERPLFPTVSRYGDMDVVVLPEHGPFISGFCPKYHLGGKVHVNCTSGHSRPATQLSWYINGEPLSNDHQHTTSYRSESELILTTLTLRFEVTEAYFRRSTLKVKCLANIPPVYWKSNEETAALEKTDSKHLENKIRKEKISQDKLLEYHVNFAETKLRYISSQTLLFVGVIIVKLYMLLIS